MRLGSLTMFHVKTCNFFNLNIIVTITFMSLSQSILAEEESGNWNLSMGLNPSVDPCTDFYEYACGNWAKHQAVDQSLSSLTHSSKLSAETKRKIVRLLTERDATTDNIAIRKARKVYRACMNTDKIKQAGVDPIISIINQNGGWPLIMKPGVWTAKRITWQQVHSRLFKNFGFPTLFSISVDADSKDSSINRINIFIPELEITYWVDPDNLSQVLIYSENKVNRMEITTNATRYQFYVKQLQELNDFAIELQEIVPKNANEFHYVIPIDGLQRIFNRANMNSSTAKINWLETIRDIFTLTPEITMDGSEKINLYGISYFRKIAALLNKTSSETIVNYMMWQLVMNASRYTYEVTSHLENGEYSNKVRAYDCVKSSHMESAVSYAFGMRYFSPESKQAVMELTNNVHEAFKENIRQSTWMDSVTKNVTIEKIDAIVKLIGYPDYYNSTNIDDYYTEFIPTDSYFENERRRRIFTIKNMFRKLGESTDKTEWYREPSEVTATNYINRNTILIAAGYLQPPMFVLNRPRIINYAMTGFIIGHEISHALDTTGRQYDKNGDEVIWWSQSAIDRYEERAQCFIHQFNNYTLYDDGQEVIPVNGDLTLEENIADTTGVKVSWEAYKTFREKNGIIGVHIPGFEEFTEDQIFFLAFGYSKCAYASAMYLKNKRARARHSPPKARVNGPVSNSKEFATAFNCSANSLMNPSTKCSIF